MKKLLAAFITILMVFTLIGCKAKENKVITQETQEQKEKTKDEPEILGGYVDVADGTLTDELKDIFSKALEGLTGATYEPQELVATQVVAGTNYKFLANGTKTTNPITKGTYYITIYKDLQGNVELLDIETIEEKQEDVNADSSINDTEPSKYNYWVVFYNPDGNELQRDSVKYGAIPKYNGDTPLYWDDDYWYKFVCWTDKQGNEITDFKPIKGNTYIYAKYEIGGKNKSNENESNVTPAPTVGCTKTSDYLLYITSLDLPFDIYADVYEWKSDSNKYVLIEGYYHIDGMKMHPIPTTSDVWIHTDDYNNPGNPTTGHQQYCDDFESHNITCFIAGTQVQYDLFGHTKNIEDFKVGDQIVSYNVNTNNYYLAKVENVFVHDDSEKVRTLADVLLEDGSRITMTLNHPVLTTAGFKAIDNDHRPELKKGQFVMTNNGWSEIKDILVYDCEPTVTYNLGIIDYVEIIDNDEYDTYVAGGIVVHNLY